jgi:hypothetical protein
VDVLWEVTYMSILRNYTWNVAIVVAQVVVGLIVYWYTNSPLTAFRTALAATVVIGFIAVVMKSEDAFQTIVLNLSAIFALRAIQILIITTPLSFRVSILFALAVVCVCVSAYEREQSFREWTLNFFANLPLGIGVILGGGIWFYFSRKQKRYFQQRIDEISRSN